MNFNKFLCKLISILLIIGLNGTGLSAIGQTLASFSDEEISLGNIFGASSLDFQLDSSQDFFPPTPGEPNKLIREIKIINQGSLNFKYHIRIGNYSGALCENLKLSANLNGGEIECATSNLTGFYCGPFEISNDIENWQFTASLSEGGFFSQACTFNLVFEAWQSNFSAFSGGFFDQEEIENEITKHYSEVVPELSIVINEFLPNPVGPDDAEKPEGEWVELYNKGRFSVPLRGWFLSDLQGNLLQIPNSTIPPKGFLVVYLDGKYSPGWLNNRGKDGVSLWAPKNPHIPPKRCFGGYCIIDAHFYRGEVPEGKSFARIPDGSENWFDPLPTPGSANQLSPEEEASLQPEVIELSQEQLFQMFIEQLSDEPIFELNESSSLGESSSENETINEGISTSTISTSMEELIPQSNSNNEENSVSSVSFIEAESGFATSTEAVNTVATSTEGITFEESPFDSEGSGLEISDQTTTEEVLEATTTTPASATTEEVSDEATFTTTTEGTTTQETIDNFTSTEDTISSAEDTIFSKEMTIEASSISTTTPEEATSSEEEGVVFQEEISITEPNEDSGNVSDASLEGVLPKSEELKNNSEEEAPEDENGPENEEENEEENGEENEMLDVQ